MGFVFPLVNVEKVGWLDEAVGWGFNNNGCSLTMVHVAYHL